MRHTGAPKFGNTAMPWVDGEVYHPPGSQFLTHGGGGFGYVAFVGFDKRNRRGVVVLSNQMAVNPVENFEESRSTRWDQNPRPLSTRLVMGAPGSNARSQDRI